MNTGVDLGEDSLKRHLITCLEGGSWCPLQLAGFEKCFNPSFDFLALFLGHYACTPGHS